MSGVPAGAVSCGGFGYGLEVVVCLGVFLGVCDVLWYVMCVKVCVVYRLLVYS